MEGEVGESMKGVPCASGAVGIPSGRDEPLISFGFLLFCVFLSLLCLFLLSFLLLRGDLFSVLLRVVD